MSIDEFFEKKYAETKAIWSVNPIETQWKKFAKAAMIEFAQMEMLELLKYLEIPGEAPEDLLEEYNKAQKVE